MSSHEQEGLAMSYEIEHTDTFGGEANYCWVRRYRLDGTGHESRCALVRRAKALTGLTGIPCSVDDYGGDLTIRPRGICHVVFVTWRDDADAQS
jgi:hypothetical protein